MAFQFSSDWFTNNVPDWQRIGEYKGWGPQTPITAIEIGSFEGRSACWIAENWLGHPASRLYCLDTFTGSIEHNAQQKNGLLDRFINNVGQTGRASQIEARVGRSEDSLIELIVAGVQADLIYIDGSHTAADVLTDAVFSWKLLKRGGVMIFDDYLWRTPENQLSLAPKLAVDSFVNIHFSEVTFFTRVSAYQCCLLRL